MAFGADISETLGNVGNRATTHGYNKPDEIRKQYTGYEHDDESGLDFAQARYYNSSHGRFTSIDPLTASANVKDPQTFNRYTYAMNSPYKFTDPLGLISSSTNACGRWCSNSGDWVDGSAFRGKDDSMGFNLRTQSQNPPSHPPSITMSINGVTYVGNLISRTDETNTQGFKLTLDYYWSTQHTDENGHTTTAKVSDQIDSLLDNALSRMATNSYNAALAARNFTAIGKTTVSIEAGIDGSKEGGKKGITGGGGVKGSISVEINNIEHLVNEVRNANDRIQSQLAVDLNSQSMITAWSSGKSVSIKDQKVSPKSATDIPRSLAASFGEMARKNANAEAKGFYKDMWGSSAEWVRNY